jgi:hypothetical protein
MTAAPQQPDDALAILKRLEPMLIGIATDVAVLKTDVATIKTDVAGLKTDVVALKVDVANLQGRVSQLPTSWQMLTAIVTTVIAVTGGTAAILFAALNYAKTL